MRNQLLLALCLLAGGADATVSEAKHNDMMAASGLRAGATLKCESAFLPPALDQAWLVTENLTVNICLCAWLGAGVARQMPPGTAGGASRTAPLARSSPGRSATMRCCSVVLPRPPSTASSSVQAPGPPSRSRSRERTCVGGRARADVRGWTCAGGRAWGSPRAPLHRPQHRPPPPTHARAYRLAPALETTTAAPESPGSPSLRCLYSWIANFPHARRRAGWRPPLHGRRIGRAHPRRGRRRQVRPVEGIPEACPRRRQLQRHGSLRRLCERLGRRRQHPARRHLWRHLVLVRGPPCAAPTHPPLLRSLALPCTEARPFPATPLHYSFSPFARSEHLPV